jgi:succinoglycan biosynthesis protein ExoM
MNAIDVSVVVLSYDRVHLLERTLTEILKPHIAQGVSFELIVVDNHPDRLAEGLVTNLAKTAAVPVSYYANPKRNVSIVRNVGIKAAKGAYVLFIDDDEKPEPGWIAEHFRCLERTGADASFGPKLPEFEAGAAPDWDPQALRFTLDFKEPADTELFMFGRTRRPGKGLGSGNAAFRVATCFDVPEPFAVAFGDGNGEDTHLLFRLAQEGRRFVWCPGAIVHEFMERDRTKPSYMIQRSKRGSQHYAASRIATSNSKLFTRLKVTALGLAQTLVHAGLYVVSGEAFGGRTYEHRIGMAKGMGKLTWRAPIGWIDERAA